MSNQLIKKTGDGAKAAAKAVKKTVQDESLEILKSARKQVTGEYMQTAHPPNPAPPEQAGPTEQDKERSRVESMRKYEMLQAEIKQLADQRRAEIAARQNQQEQPQPQEQLAPLSEPTTKRKRGMFGAGRAKGMRGQLEKLKRKSEIRMPPSG